MPPKGTPGTETPAKDKKKETTNFKTYESQARLLAAVVASLDGVRFDYKSRFGVSLPGNPPPVSPPFVPSRCFRPLARTSLTLCFKI
jgi:hypothetical protein